MNPKQAFLVLEDYTAKQGLTLEEEINRAYMDGYLFLAMSQSENADNLSITVVMVREDLLRVHKTGE